MVVKSIIFDIGGVLELGRSSKYLKNHSSLGVHEYASKELNLSLDQYFDSIDTTYAMAIEGQISENESIRILSLNFKINKKKLLKLYKKAYEKNFKTNKELYKFAFKLKKQGYKIAILSDQWYLSKKAVVKEKYAKKFNAVVVSCDVGMRKPNPKIYKLVLKKLNLHAKNCIFIDNQPWNIKPAKKLGMKTILFKDNKQVFNQLEKWRVKV